MDVFPAIAVPDYGLEDNPKADVEEVKLGDGYVFRRPTGINYLSYEWPLKWDALDVAVARSTHAWLTARLMLIPFLWTHPVRGVVYKVICTEAKLVYNNFNDEILTATFKQDFNP